MAVSDVSLLDAVPDTGRGISAVLGGPIPAGVSLESVEMRFHDVSAAHQRLALEAFLPA